MPGITGQHIEDADIINLAYIHHRIIIYHRELLEHVKTLDRFFASTKSTIPQKDFDFLFEGFQEISKLFSQVFSQLALHASRYGCSRSIAWVFYKLTLNGLWHCAPFAKIYRGKVQLLRRYKIKDVDTVIRILSQYPNQLRPLFMELEDRTPSNHPDKDLVKHVLQTIVLPFATNLRKRNEWSTTQDYHRSPFLWNGVVTILGCSESAARNLQATISITETEVVLSTLDKKHKFQELLSLIDIYKLPVDSTMLKELSEKATSDGCLCHIVIKKKNCLDFIGRQEEFSINEDYMASKTFCTCALE